MSFVKGSGSSSKTRGVLCLLVGYIVLFVMDSDTYVEDHAEAHKHQSGLNHVFYHIAGWFGISDHKGGVLLLLFAVILKMGYDSNFRHLAVEVGGPKRLYAMVTVLSTVFLIPMATLALVLSSSFISSYLHFLVLLLVAAVFVMVIDFYAESICFQHVADAVMAVARWSPIVMFSSSLLISWIWYENSIASAGAHAISGGVVITVIFFCAASFILTSPTSPRSRAGHFVGISEGGMPLYTHGEAFLQRTSKYIFEIYANKFHWITPNVPVEHLTIIIMIGGNKNAFCGVEFCYGFWTNSLGLISDGFHMLFDCSALVMGLVASVMARWTASRFYSFGYGRVEVLSGFINALFLIVIALFIFLEALERLYDPPNIQTDKLMFVAVAGLCVNLFGMYAFHHGHSHGGESDHGHSHGGEKDCDSHGNGGSSHGHSHSQTHAHSHGHSHGGNANMQGVFLHILADTLGSVFVIISTLLIQFFGWQWVDPLCSLILSVLILGSVYPLLKSSASVLLQSVPDEVDYVHALDEISHVEGVHDHTQFHAWQLKSGVNVASIHVKVSDDANDQIVRQRINQILRKYGATQISVQVEKEAFIRRLNASYSSNHHQRSEHYHSKMNNGGHAALNLGYGR
ncbi:cation efflux family domain-containing protein [Ditylenchus destructor]|uniref:Proton-coupled zinc antiporter SLC30A5 n=1 Tax=Ditylenchus destructor TaxID=166010 RepID=A0AAD4MX17_9BILA|nr:cation efflux family domain-containing protein [Ditylenchus destructor]